ncbi:MAG: flagellar biosynthesis protein FlhB [Vampirovibrio sp.]|nr:flagellar biosynthesis protein FlhB [Vampirovibrio sp.]
MSGASGEKTEKPTPRRMQEARERGQVAKSQDLNGALILGSATLLMVMVGPYTYNTLFSMTKHIYSNLLTAKLTEMDIYTLISEMSNATILLILPFFLGVLTMGLLANLMQVKPLFTVKPLMPKLDKINPIQGFKRLFSMKSIVEVVKAILKMAIIGGCGIFIITSYQGELLSGGTTQNPWASAMNIVQVLGLVAFWASTIFLVLGLIDWRYQAYEMEKQLRMSRQEIKDERKNLEGDPLMKGQMRKMGMQLARKRQLAEVPKADVVITNPTHFSIAIQYDPDVSPAPRVVAKGVDHFAFKIREVAKEAGVPMVENKPLAQSLYKTVEAGHMIPPDLFVAVAEVLAFVFSKNKGRKMKQRLT